MKPILLISAALAALLTLPVYAADTSTAPADLGINFAVEDSTQPDQADEVATNDADTDAVQTDVAPNEADDQVVEAISDQPPEMAETADADTQMADTQTEQAALDASEQLAANHTEDAAMPFTETVAQDESEAEPSTQH